MATGFLAAGVHSTQITSREVEKHRYDEMDDMLSTTTTAFLGLTVGCARCHDHKFDPFPQRDYYQLLSTFTKTVRNQPKFSCRLGPITQTSKRSSAPRDCPPHVYTHRAPTSLPVTHFLRRATRISTMP